MGAWSAGDEAASDEELALALGAGDVQAFTVLHERYDSLCYDRAYRILEDKGSAEDVVQEVFLNIWHCRATFDRTRGNFRSWLLVSISNRAISRLRGRAGRTRRDYPLDTVANRLFAEDSWPAVETTLLREEVQRGLAALPGEQRLVIELTFLAGHARAAIAEALGLPIGTVKGRIRLGLGKLRQILADPATLPGSSGTASSR